MEKTPTLFISVCGQTLLKSTLFCRKEPGQGHSAGKVCFYSATRLREKLASSPFFLFFALDFDSGAKALGLAVLRLSFRLLFYMKIW